ncbi:MAG TPA: ABC transporter permease [Gemmatimonadaceae bacterium]|nr:ABC transporter permease [Gemmatimonadaceae bacterium]
MSVLAALRHRLRTLLRPAAYARELREEIEFHLSLEAMEQSRGPEGSMDDAPYAARRRFGNVTRYSEETREMSGLGFFDVLRHDARFAFRTFRQAKGFTAVAVATIALGIGATAAVFSVVDALILKPLPYPEADRVVMVWMDNRRLALKEDVHSYPNLMDLKAQNRSLSHLNAYYEAGFNLTGAGEPQRVLAGVVSAEVFAALSARPIIGQLFDAENERTGNDGVVVIGEGLWKSNFGGDRGILGRAIELNGKTRTVVGVLPAAFGFPSERTQLWVPLVIPDGMRTARSAFSYWAVGKLKPGISLEHARTDLGAIAKRLAEQYPSNRDYGVTVTPLPEQIVGPTLRTMLWITLGAVGAVLLIACANVANLLLSRAAAREREITVRMALGASHRRLVRQLLTESILLSALGGAAGIALALGALRILPRLAPSDLPRLSTISLNGSVLLVTSLATVLTGVLFGLVPAVQASRARLSENLREGSRGGTAGRSGQRLRRSIVAAELALVVVLLTTAGLLLRTWVTLQQTELGFSTKNVLTMTLQLPAAKYPRGAQVAAFYEGLLDRVRAVPGVENAGTIQTMMLSATPSSGTITAEGRASRRDDKEMTFDETSPDFFDAIGARIVAGRAFTAGDRNGTQPVAIVNEHAVKSYFPNGAIGRRFRFGLSNEPSDSVQNPWITIVGVVADMRRTGVDKAVRDEAFFPIAQGGSSRQLLVVRTQRDPLSFVPQVRRVVHEMDPAQPISDVQTMDHMLSGLVAQRRFSMTLLAVFAGLALTLALIGTYGVTSYLVSQRTREIGIRMALGADAGRVARSVVREGMRVAGAGVFAGFVIALLTTRLASGLLYGVSPRDPLTLTTVVATLLAVSALANYLPARRAARVDPLTALRQD